MRLKSGRSAVITITIALAFIIGISMLIYRISSPQAEQLLQPGLIINNAELEENILLNKTVVEYSFEGDDLRNTLKGPHTEVADCHQCTNGKQVVGLFEGGSVQFNHVEVPEAGKYIMTVYYTSGDSRSIFLEVNGSAQPEKYDFPEVGRMIGIVWERMNLRLN